MIIKPGNGDQSKSGSASIMLTNPAIGLQDRALNLTMREDSMGA
jgi:hypothetical protein